MLTSKTSPRVAGIACGRCLRKDPAHVGADSGSLAGIDRMTVAIFAPLVVTGAAAGAYAAYVRKDDVTNGALIGAGLGLAIPLATVLAFSATH